MVTGISVAALAAGAWAYRNAARNYEQERRDAIRTRVEGHVLTIGTLKGTETVAAAEVALRPVVDDALEKRLRDPYALARHLLKRDTSRLVLSADCDVAKLAAKVRSLECAQVDSMYAAGDGHISEYIPELGYQLVSGTPGTLLDTAKLYRAVRRRCGGWTRT